MAGLAWTREYTNDAGSRELKRRRHISAADFRALSARLDGNTPRAPRFRFSATDAAPLLDDPVPPRRKNGAAPATATDIAPVREGKDPAFDDEPAKASDPVPSQVIADPVAVADDTIREILDIMSLPGGEVQPQERALAADTLAHLIECMPLKQRVLLAERVAIMENPPAALAVKLARDKAVEVSGPILMRSAHLDDQDLLSMVNDSDESTRKLIAGRRFVSPVLASALIEHGEPAVILELVRNTNSQLSSSVMKKLAEIAKSDQSLMAPLATRPEMTPPVAFELFWSLPRDLRRYVFSRFLTDSQTLEKILRVVMMTENAETPGDSSDHARCFVDERRVERIVSLITDGACADASRLLASASMISPATAERIIDDADGEPLTVVFKAMGVSRVRFSEAFERLRASSFARLDKERSVVELQHLFDSLSFNKARMVLTYWDWLSRSEKNAA